MRTTSPKIKRYNLHLFVIVFFLLTSYIAIGQVGINTVTPNSTLEINGSLSQKVGSISATTTLGASDNTIICKNGTNPITINLPSVSSPDCAGRIYTIKKGSMSDSTADVTIDGNGTQKIDGSETFLLSDDQGAVTIVNDGTEWKIISDHLSPYPMGEVSYFNTTGHTVTINAASNGSTNMVICNVPTPVIPTPPDTVSKLQSMPMGEFSTNELGRLIYNGKTTRTFHIACTISVSPTTNNDELVFGVAKGKGNGTGIGIGNDVSTVVASSKIIQKMGTSADSQSTAMHVVIVLAKGDFIELRVGDISGANNVVVKSLNLFALGI